MREAGGIITDLKGDAYTIATRPIIASNAAAHRELQQCLAEANVVGLDEAD